MSYRPEQVMPSCFGLVVCPCERVGGGFFYAEVVPAPLSYWRPWRYHRSRWWFEVHSTDPNDDIGTTYAYQKGGSGGGFTLRSCIVKANEAVERFLTEDYAEHRSRSNP